MLAPSNDDKSMQAIIEDLVRTEDSRNNNYAHTIADIADGKYVSREEWHSLANDILDAIPVTYLEEAPAELQKQLQYVPERKRKKAQGTKRRRGHPNCECVDGHHCYWYYVKEEGVKAIVCNELNKELPETGHVKKFRQMQEMLGNEFGNGRSSLKYEYLPDEEERKRKVWNAWH